VSCVFADSSPSFGPILFKQVPYTMAKFAVYEIAVEKILQVWGKTKGELSGGQTTSLNLGGGLIAGMAAAVISQPADTLLSKINKTKGAPGQSVTSRLIQMAGQLGPSGLFTGMGARLVMIGTLTAGQCECKVFSQCVVFRRNHATWRLDRAARQKADSMSYSHDLR
jgi:flagellar biosynthesis component FlhA